MTAYFRFIVPNKRICGDFQNKIEPSKAKIGINKSLQRFPVPQTSNWTGRKTFWEAQYFQVALDTKSSKYNRLKKNNNKYLSDLYVYSKDSFCLTLDYAGNGIGKVRIF